MDQSLKETDLNDETLVETIANDFSDIEKQIEETQEEWTRELEKTEEEIQTLRVVLSDKEKKSQELKRKLGITVWNEFRDDVEQGIKNVQEATPGALHKTGEAVKTASEKTTSVIGAFGGSFARKFGEVKSSNAFKTFGERVGYAVTNVKSKMSGSRTNSTSEDPLDSTEMQTSSAAPENKAIP